MSAETLRKAAALMRKNAATEATLREVPDGLLITEMSQYELRWNPDVAVAVAGVLELAADKWDPFVNPQWVAQTLAVARAYLGDDA